ncbi:YheC/YheD family protein [Bacillus sp. V5-8f]|uniref:YheC/YheD family endospore coat-associated protein n=1 Tax=Bacillus sp. V5-8f TaxID=2053044 RepID=UPI0015E08D2E|nr:YheC/YheD family protein [Bacillus sp. V5-8f]
MATRKHAEEPYFTKIAQMSEEAGVQVFRFCPDQIKIHEKTVYGDVFDQQLRQWIPKDFTIPDFIYDRHFRGLIRNSDEISHNIKWLKKNAVFLGHGLPGKYKVFQSLSKIDSLSRFLPPTNKVRIPEDIWLDLSIHSRVMLKPEFGSKGTGIYLIENKENGSLVRMTKKEGGFERLFDKKAALHKWFRYLIEQCPYLTQPYLELSNAQGKPWDLRILIQKDSSGMWTERVRGARLGRAHCITANLAAGAQVIPFDIMLKGFPLKLQGKIQESIDHIIQHLPHELETRIARLFELGLDLGVDKKGDVWILDINSKPGRKIMELLDPDNMHKLYKAPSLYCTFLNAELLKAGE